MKTAKLTELSQLLTKLSSAVTNKSEKEISEVNLLPTTNNHRTEMSLNFHFSIMEGEIYELEREILELIDSSKIEERKDFVIDLYYYSDSIKKIKDLIEKEKMEFGKVNEDDSLSISIWQNITVRYDMTFSLIESLNRKIVEFENFSSPTGKEELNNYSSSINKIKVNMSQFDLALLAQVLRRMDVFSDYHPRPYDKSFFNFIEAVFMCKNDKGLGYRDIKNFKDTISKPLRSNSFDKNIGKQKEYHDQVYNAIEILRDELKRNFDENMAPPY